ncbi:hypothetical protein [Mycoplasma sp. CSL7503-lung]|uniref:hypothetical protein n=1 Tax=Mycoplasma sp. CSL7503-lung TaxID=536372 RepID=UPI0021D07BF2|nr:hypothetical protein [Mycoplasma sp. CSL7503-lung]MCU4706790.1 hypothetical protein [Mycoplasma sp. CSL7503-lung]
MFHTIQEYSTKDSNLTNKQLIYEYNNFRIDRRVYDESANLDYQIEIFNYKNNKDLYLFCDFFSNKVYKEWIIELWYKGSKQLTSNNSNFIANISSLNKSKVDEVNNFKIIIKSKKTNKIVESLEFNRYLNENVEIFEMQNKTNLLKIQYSSVFRIKNNQVLSHKKYWNLIFNLENLKSAIPIFNVLNLFITFDANSVNLKSYKITSLDFNVNKISLNINGLGLEKEKIKLKGIRKILQNNENKFDLVDFYIDEYIKYLPDEERYIKSLGENSNRKIVIPKNYNGKLIFIFELETTFGNFKILKEIDFDNNLEERKAKKFEINDITDQRVFLNKIKYTVSFRDFYNLKNENNISYFLKKNEEYQIDL